MSAQQGDLIGGRYRLGGAEPSGWYAHDETDDREVLLRAVPAAGLEAARAARTAREAPQGSAHIVPVLDVVAGADGGWLVLERIPGRTLAELVGRFGGLPLPQVTTIARRLLDALEAVGPEWQVRQEDVLLGDDGRVLLIPGGAADRSGTPGDAAPGSGAGLFSLGEVLFGAAEGRAPSVEAPGAGTVVQPTLVPLIRGLMERRFGVADARAELGRLAGEGPASEPGPTKLEPAASPTTVLPPEPLPTKVEPPAASTLVLPAGPPPSTAAAASPPSAPDSTPLMATVVLPPPGPAPGAAPAPTQAAPIQPGPWGPPPAPVQPGPWGAAPAPIPPHPMGPPPPPPTQAAQIQPAPMGPPTPPAGPIHPAPVSMPSAAPTQSAPIYPGPQPPDQWHQQLPANPWPQPQAPNPWFQPQPPKNTTGRNLAVVLGSIALVAAIVVGIVLATRTSSSSDTVSRTGASASSPGPAPSAASSSFTYPQHAFTPPTSSSSSSEYTPPPVDTPSTDSFDPATLNDKNTDQTPLTGEGFLPQQFVDDQNVVYTLRASGTHDCVQSDMSSNIRNLLSDNECTTMLTGSYIDKDDRILVSVEVFPFVDEHHAVAVFDAIKGASGIDYGIWCPTSGTGSEACKGDYHQATVDQYTEQNHRYVVSSLAVYINLSGSSSATPWVTSAAKKAVDAVGPQNYSGNQ